MLSELDKELAKSYGAYASYPTEHDPVAVETYGDGPEEEKERLLGVYAKPESCVLDLGCGAGFTLCQLAPRVQQIWGFEQDERLMSAARERVRTLGLQNVTLLLGNNSCPEDLGKLPDSAFDLAFTWRGPHATAPLMPKLKQEAYFIQEVYQWCLGLNEIFGRDPKMFVPHSAGAADWFDGMYGGLGMLPVSTKNYYFGKYFRDADHLAAYLGTASFLSEPYDPARDRAALELYVRYNTTPKGVRLMCHRKIGVFRRT